MQLLLLIIGIANFALTIFITTKLKKIMADLSKLQDEVANDVTVEQSAITLLQGLSAEIAALPADQGAIDDLAAKVKSSADALAAAVVANTPAAPTV